MRKGLIKGFILFCMTMVLSSCNKNMEDTQEVQSLQTHEPASESSDFFAEEIENEEYQADYTTFLDDLYDNKNVDVELEFYVKDLDCNSIPELILKKNGVALTVYTYDGDVIKIGQHDFKSGTSRFLFSDDSDYPGIFHFYVGGGYEWYSYITIEDNKLVIEELWNKDFSGISKELGKNRGEIEEISNNKKLIKASKKAYKRNNDLPFKKLIPSNYSGILMEKNISLCGLDEEYLISTTKRKLTDINLRETDKFVEINNNILNGNFIHPYKDGYYYTAENGMDYDNGKGKIAKQIDFDNIIHINKGRFFYLEDGCLKSNANKEIIDFRNSCWDNLFFTKEYIYYVENVEENKKSYIYRVDYERMEEQILYELDVNVQQIYIYRNKLWIMFCEYGEYDKNELGVIDFKEDEVNTYRGIYPKGKSICINNGYLYFNSSGLKRLNLEDNSVEEVFEQNVEGINFTVDNILCYVGKRLFAINTNGVKELKRLTGETAGFGGIRIEENMIYIHSFQGAFSNQIYQIDEEGRIIKKID